MVYSVRFLSSKCSLFHNSNVFGSCIIHMLYTGCAKFLKNIYVLNILNMVYTVRFFSSKCSLFHNSNVFGSGFIHILYAVCVLKFRKKNISGAKRLMRTQHWWNDTDRGKPKYSEENVYQYNFVHHKSHVD